MKRGERQRLEAVLEELTALIDLASRVRQIAGHLPISHGAELDDYALWLLKELSGVEASGDIARAQIAIGGRWYTGSKADPGAEQAAARLSDFHEGVVARSDTQRLQTLETELAARRRTEWDQLNVTLEQESEFVHLLEAALLDDAHVAFSDGVLSAAEKALMADLIREGGADQLEAKRLLDPAVCAAGVCSQGHIAVERLFTRMLTSQRDGWREQLASAVGRVGRVGRAEQAQAARLIFEADALVRRIANARSRPASMRRQAEASAAEAIRGGVDFRQGGMSCRLVPLRGESPLKSLLTAARDSRLSVDDDSALRAFHERALDGLSRIRTNVDSHGMCTRDVGCRDSHQALRELNSLLASQSEDCERVLDATQAPAAPPHHILDPSLELRALLPERWVHVEFVTSDAVAAVLKVAPRAVDAAAELKGAVKRAKEAAEAVRNADVEAALRGMDLEVLKKAVDYGNIRAGALTRAGLLTVWDVLQHSEGGVRSLTSIQGIGDESSWIATQAALRLYEGVRDETPVRIDVKTKGPATRRLLEALREWDVARRFEPTPQEIALCSTLRILFSKQHQGSELLVGGPLPAARISEAFDALLEKAKPAKQGNVWTDFLSRPADYFGLLIELGFTTEDEKKMHGDLPEEIIEAVRSQELVRTHLTASLRAYQGFGARFALTQRRIVLGDEMGLGKTVEALAVMAHLRAKGSTHFVVVCPAAVVSNWMREVPKHTKLHAHRLHGQEWERQRALSAWQRGGGVAVTTYGLLQRYGSAIMKPEPSCAVFDEAHYIKNPHVIRSLASEDLIGAVEHAILMTGTPLENSVQEFRNLIGYLRPDLAESAPEFLASKFRKHVAPAYLRRNQEDVLTELPELVEVDDWLGSADGEAASYREAVRAGDFMLMRRAAMLEDRSVKVERLKEIVAEAEANGRRVIVFSYFRDVLDHLAAVLPGKVFGPLTGSVAAGKRQTIVDEFSAAEGGAVLVAQITAGGVGLNIQSASVVVICEPQLKPTTEDQAIARAHRMGQTTSVQVHRLLTEGSVDERIRDILAEKREVFDEFARNSVIAQRAPDAVDMTDAELARQVIAGERERLFGQSQSVAVSEGP